MKELALQRRLIDIETEYNEKLANVDQASQEFKGAGEKLKMASTVAGSWGRTNLDVGSVWESTMKESLRKSAWWAVYDGLQISRLASANDKRIIEREMENPPEFTMDNVRATFGRYILDPRSNILRGLAEVFCSLDQSYKSHEKVKIGVKGLPKRVIISSVNSYGYGYDKIKDILNALASYQNKPLIDHREMQLLLKDEYALIKSNVFESVAGRDNLICPPRGVRLRRFNNGNAHLFFDDITLKDINMALAEYYGDVLPDDASEKPTQRAESKEVSKDLQYYPTPVKVVERVMADIYIKKGDKVLEPSCGCGRFLDAIRAAGAEAYGIEYDYNRASEARNKGHSVHRANFLEQPPDPVFDRVIMNPPFYGKHYVKHVKHALKFLKDGGVLTAILPASARYDHNLLDGCWNDLPVGSFAESGTNINTTVLTIRK